MSEPGPSIGTAGRFLTGLAVALLVVLGLSFLLSSTALEDEEEEAARRAERLTSSVVAPGLTPELVTTEIEGTDYRDLLIRVQDEALARGGATAVRIWTLDGELIFSSTGNVDRVVTRNQPLLEVAADGETVWVIAEAGAGSASGLQQGEELFETFVPLMLDDQPDPSAVVQVDRRYGVIEDEATRVWRPVQVGLIIGLGVVVVLLGIVLPGSVAPAQSATPGEAAAASRTDRTLRDADERASAAERATREAEQRLVDAERRLQEASRAEAPPEIMARVDELQRKLHTAERERERSAEQVRKLRSALEAKEAAADVSATADPATSDADGKKLAELQEALAAAEQRLEEAASRSDRAGADLAGGAKDLETTTTALETKTGELNAATMELERAKSDLQFAQTELERTRTGLQAANADLEETKSRLERRLKEIDANRQAEVGEVQRAREALATTQVELLEAKSARRDAEARVQELEERAAELGAGGEREEPAAPVGSFSDRLAELRQEIAVNSRAEEGSSTDGEEVLSLRERLTRAAAARHRPPGGEEG